MRTTLAAAGILATTFLATGAVRADTVVVNPEPTEAPVNVSAAVETTSPNTPTITTGVLTFGVSYGAALIAASVSDTAEDRRMFVPLLGPWLDLADRPTCPVAETECDRTTTTKILIGADGVFQAIGVVVAVYGLLTPIHHTSGVVEVVPVTMGSGGHGLGVRGTF